MRKFLTVLITLLALLAVALPAVAGDRHDDKPKVTICHVPPGNPDNPQIIGPDKNAWNGHEHHDLDFEIVTVEDAARCRPPVEEPPEETTTTTAPPVSDVEVCRDNEIITIPADEVLETDDRIFTDSQRDNCKPPRVPPVVTPEPGPVVQFPPYSVGYACPGTDGVVVELPWGTYEDMWPTPELAKLYGCPVVEEIPVVLIAPTSTVLTELPFTGPSDSLPFLALAGLAALGMGGVLVRSARADG